ncbi:MAG: DUF554 domain-containing protein [Syntrophobacteraceae bacterium]
MTGTFINVGAIIAGSALGALAGSRLPAKMRQTVLYGIGLLTLLIGFQMALKTENILVVLGAILIGGILGEALKIEDRIESLGEFLQAKLSGGSDHTFAEGFVVSSIVFCVGPMAILGSISDGLSGDYRLLSIKAVLDGFASIAFAASLGWGVALSALSILVYQGGITLFASGISSLLTDPMVTEMTATGGLIIVGIGLKLLEIKHLRLANFVPAIAVAPVILALVPVVKGFWG